MYENFKWKLTPNTNSSYLPFFPAFSIQAALNRTYSQLFYWVEAVFDESIYSTGITALCRSGIQADVEISTVSPYGSDIYSIVHFPSSGMLKPTITTGIYSHGQVYTETGDDNTPGIQSYTSSDELSSVTFILHGGKK